MRIKNYTIPSKYGSRIESSRRLLRFCICVIITILPIMLPLSVLAKEYTSGNSTTVEKNTNQVEPQTGELHAFYPSYAVFSPQIEKYIDNLDSISFAWSRIDAVDSFTINTVKGKNGNYGFYYPNDYLRPIEYAKSKGKTIQLSVYMEGTDCVKLLLDVSERSSVIQDIVTTMQTDITQGKGIYYDGVVIDFEGLRNTDVNKADILHNGNQISTYFTQFLNELKVELDTLDKKLYVAVNPAIYYDGYNYTDILDVADRVIIMAHDYEPMEKLQKNQVQQYTSYDTLIPINSLAPIQMVRQALNDIQSAASDVSQLSKVWLQISFDTAQWQFDVNSEKNWVDLPGKTFSRKGRLSPLYKSIKARVDNTDGYGQNISYGYNNELQSPYIQYYNSSDGSWNVLIYEDSNSISAKIELAKSYKLGGISLWSLSNVPDYNDSLGKQFRLNGWATIISKMNSYDTYPSKSSKYVSFTDDAMEQAIREKLGKESGKISVWEMQNIYRLKLPVGVKSLKDIKKLTNLEYLDARQLNLKDITAIGSLKKLQVLFLQNNSITDISAISSLKKLKVLSLNGNNISDLKSLSKVTSLEKLYLKDNKIKSIVSLKGLNNLTELYLNGNSILTYSPVKTVHSKKGFLCDFKIN